MKKVLFIKSNQLGDSVVNLPVVQELANRLGGENVGVITTPIAKDIYQNYISDSNIFVMSRDSFNSSWKHMSDLFRILRWIREFNPTAILVPSDQGYVARLLAVLFSSRRFYQMENNLVSFPHLCSTWVDLDRSVSMHQNDWNLLLAFASDKGWENVPQTPPRPSKIVAPATMPAGSRHKILIHPGSSRSATQWEKTRFAELAACFAAAGIEVLWIDESEVLPAPNPLIHILKRGTLSEFAHKASECSLFIGNNSGPMHLCDALNVPLLVLTGPAGAEWDPCWAQPNLLLRLPELECQPCETRRERVTECPRTDEPFACLQRVTVDLVFQKAIAMLPPNSSSSKS